MSESDNMIKTIKRTKSMRLDELIKYVWDNDIKHKTYEDVNNMELEIRFSPYGYLDSTPQNVTPSDLFKVEVEEEITEDTEFRVLIEIFSKTHTITHNFKSVKEIKDDGTEKIYALIDGELQKVWQRCEENDR